MSARKTTTEWKLVPVNPTQEMLEAAAGHPMLAITEAAYAAMLAASPAPSESPQWQPGDDIPESVLDAVAAAIGDAYDCNRVWSAWQIGAMGPEDFSRVAEDGDRVAEIAGAALMAAHAVLPTPPEQAAQHSMMSGRAALVEAWGALPDDLRTSPALEPLYRAIQACDDFDEDGWPKLDRPAKVGGVSFGRGASTRLVVDCAQRLHDMHAADAVKTREQHAIDERNRRMLWDMLNGGPPPGCEQAAQPAGAAAPCAGMNCGATDGVSHSPECCAEHAAALAGGRFVKDEPADVARLATTKAAVAVRSIPVGAVRAAPEAPEQAGIPDGHVVVPLHMNAEMRRVTETDGWTWADLLAAAGAITDLEYDLVSLRGDEASCAPEQAAQPADVAPIDMVLHCPNCGLQHIDKADEPRRLPNGNVAHGCELCDGEDECTCPGSRPRWWTNPPHRSHLCRGCGHIWRPADVPTNGVAAVKTKGKADSPIRSPADVARLATTKAARDVLAERRRQIEAEGWTPQHDDNHDAGELASAASAYALAAADELDPRSRGAGAYPTRLPGMWPWDCDSWKPDDPRRMLVKAGALILAEIERLDRAALAAKGGA